MKNPTTPIEPKFSKTDVAWISGFRDMTLGCGGAIPTSQESDAYWKHLRDLELIDVRAAMYEATHRGINGTYRPTVEQIRDLAEDARIERLRAEQKALPPVDQKPFAGWTAEEEAEWDAFKARLGRKLSAQEQLDPQRVQEWEHRK